MRKKHSRSYDPIQHELQELSEVVRHVRRWPFSIAVLVIGMLVSVLSGNLTPGPNWGLLVFIGCLLIPLYVAILRGHHVWTRRIGILITFIVTVGVLISVILLVIALFHHTEGALALFRDAAILWSANVLVFAVWYWEVDQGGPIRRHAHQPELRDFLFPQMTSNLPEWESWTPNFIDYLFLAFNTSTAFSPTDTMVMSRRCKVLMMAQSSISLMIIAVLAARAINIA
ncbi:hypothetical protein [Alicyclobacillus kakegawensis]|uniref:hypothetical protein n=1 Tax=Alicyclobacillus kakegawensis TaxID=392012 RepID=UPI00082E1551|nr:hypothetical protein [Alicyclobacillus kakegawensis]